MNTDNIKDFVDVPIGDVIPNQSLTDIQIFAFNEAEKKLTKFIENYSNNNYNFEYEFICRVNVKRII